MEARRSEKGRLAAVYYFVCWKAGLLARPGGQSEACFHGRPGRWPTNPAPSWREHATSRVDEHLLPASRVAPVCFPSWKPFTQPSPRLLSLSLSLAAASPCAFVRPSVYPLYMCLWLAALCFARQASCFFSPAPLLPFSLYHSFSLSLSRSSFFPLQNFSGFYGARSSDSRTLVRTYRRTPVRDTDRRGLTSTHPPPPPTPLSGVFDLNPGQWERRGGERSRPLPSRMEDFDPGRGLWTHDGEG